MFCTVINFNVIICSDVLSQDEIEKFKMDQIYMDIVKTEKEEKCMLEWLQTLYLHTYQMYLDPPPSAQLDSDDEAGPQANPRERINRNKDRIPIDKDGNPLKIDTAHSSKEQTTQQITNSETCESREGGESSQAFHLQAVCVGELRDRSEVLSVKATSGIGKIGVKAKRL